LVYLLIHFTFLLFFLIKLNRPFKAFIFFENNKKPAPCIGTSLTRVTTLLPQQK
jgi:hypothetical protein